MDFATTLIAIRKSRSRAAVAALLVAGCSLAVGCGKAGPPQGRVAGKVTLDGRPLGSGQVHLYSRKLGTGGRATLDAAGNFKMPAPLPTGEYTAMVTPPPPTDVPGVPARSAPAAGSNPPAAQSAAIPVIYWSETTSELTVKVEADKEVVVTLELHGDGQPAPETPAATAPNVATTAPAESPAPQTTVPLSAVSEKDRSEKAPAENPSVEKTPVAALPAETANVAPNPSSPAAAGGSAGAAGPSWLLAALGGGGLVLAAVAAGTFILLRRRSAPAPARWTPAVSQPVSPAGHGQSAAYPRFARPTVAEKPSAPPETSAATPPGPGADRTPVAPPAAAANPPAIVPKPATGASSALGT